MVFFNYFFFNYFFSYRESIYVNQLRVLCFDTLNKYLILISFIIFITSYISMWKTLKLERKFLILFLFLISILLFSTINFLLFFILLERVLLPMIYLFFYYRDYKQKFSSLSYMFVITLIFRSPLLLLILNGLKIRIEVFNKFFFNINFLIFFLLIIRFLIKLPVYRVHFWLPKAHVDAPVSRSIILARIILKYRGYRLIRSIFFLEYFLINYYFILFIIFLGRIGYFIIRYICLQILDIKVLIAFSSVRHISFAILRNIIINFIRLKRSVYIYIRHRLISPLLFFFSYLIYFKFNTRLINCIYRVGKKPGLKSIIIFIFLINLGFPPFINFLSEVFIFICSFIFIKFLFFFFFFGFFFNRLYHIKIISLIIIGKLGKKEYTFLYKNSLLIFIMIYNFLMFSFFIKNVF